jgi:NADH dehydrogenase [ubiquinone] 1 alpha subcomplex assembly factor 7
VSLAGRIAAMIRADGPLAVDRYMDLALLDPAAGYYATRDPFGAHGDFITAPEVSQVFGELIGLWCADLWQRMGAPDPVILAELGPGRGTLMRDALRACRVVPGFLRAKRLHLVERSPVLRDLQARAVGEATWHDDAADLPDGPLLLVANEFLDALPIRQFVRAIDGWHERRIGLAGDGQSLRFTLDRAPSPDAFFPIGAPLGSLCEICPAALAVTGALSSRLVAQGGAALFIDYGRSTTEWGETLQAVRRHATHAVLDEPGSADLTAFVDFPALAVAARSAGAQVWGPVGQGEFLSALGIAAREAALVAKAAPDMAATIRTACRRLVDPAQMGFLFKAMALTAPTGPPPAGFGTAP